MTSNPSSPAMWRSSSTRSGAWDSKSRSPSKGSLVSSSLSYPAQCSIRASTRTLSSSSSITRMREEASSGVALAGCVGLSTVEEIEEFRAAIGAVGFERLDARGVVVLHSVHVRAHRARTQEIIGAGTSRDCAASGGVAGSSQASHAEGGSTAGIRS